MTLDRRAALSAIAGATLAPASLAATPGGVGAATIRIAQTEVEWQAVPIGIDTLTPRFGWSIIPVRDGLRNVAQTGWHIIVATSRVDAVAGRGTIWDSGARRSTDQRVRPERALGLRTHGEYWWSARAADDAGHWSDWSIPFRFVTGVLEPAHWSAQWIASRSDPVLAAHAAGQASALMVPAQPLPVFRREFDLPARPVRATLSIAGLGQYALTINGAGVGDAALAPGWTNYRLSVLYDTYDVTDLLNAGANVFALMLGNGMYNVEHLDGRYTKFLDSFGAPKAILRLTIEDASGTQTVVASDAQWRTIDGPIRFSSIYGGEDVDARWHPRDWDRAGFDDRHWQMARSVAGPGGVLRASNIPPVRVVRTLTPVAITEPAPGVTLFDFGENFSGRPSIGLVAAAGVTCTLTPGETLDAGGRVSQESFNAGPGHATLFRFTTAGEGLENFTPRFSYHGFRYVEVTGVSRNAIRAMTAEFLHADCARIGTFAAGVPLLGEIHHLIDQAVSSNMMSVLTDCPHREKLGWLEQTYLNAPTVFYNRDAISLYEKLAVDIAEAQQPDGMVPGIAPEYVAFVNAEGQDQIWRNSPEWGAAAVLAPWAAYRFYGDETILHTAYPAAERYIAYLETRVDHGLIDFGMGDWYDIGPSDPGPAQLTSRVLTGTAIFQQSLATMARIAARIGRSADARRYRARANLVAEAFNARFLDPGYARYDRGSQTALAMPLALGIVPEPHRTAVIAALVTAVRRDDNGVTAGDIGFRYVLDALAGAERDDVILDMLSVTGRPSYGYQIAHGATALTEAWDANPTKSLNHFMLGHAEDWLYRRLAGLAIDHAAPSAAALTIAPRILPSVREASASYRLRAGTFGCAWRIAGNRLDLTATVPPNRVATIHLPEIAPATLREGGRRLSRSAGILSLRTTAQQVTLVVGSGDYAFGAALRASPDLTT